jgi:hypothetical protein
MSGMAGVLVEESNDPLGTAFNYHWVGQSVLGTCGFQTVVPVGRGFDDWRRPCCTRDGDGNLVCPPEENPVRV